MNFDINFEETILARCLTDQVFLKKAAPLLNGYHFATAQHSWIWTTTKSIWDTYREKPTGRLLVSRAKHDFVKDEDLKIHLELVRKISKQKVDTANATLAELTEFVRFVNAQKVLEDAAKLLEKHQINEAWSVLNKASRQDVNPQDYKMIKWYEEFDQRQQNREYEKNHPDENPRIPTPFKRLNQILTGGMRLEEFGLVLGTTGRGKSMVLANIAYQAAINNFPVVYFTFEMTADEIAERLDSRWTMYETNKFKTFEFKPSELRDIGDRYRRHSKMLTNKLIIVGCQVSKTTVSDLNRYIDDLEQEESFIPKMIVVDSGDHMAATRRYSDPRHAVSEVYWSLKSLGQERHAAIWSSVHAGRAYAKMIADAESVSENYDKSRIADLVLSINLPDKTRATVNIQSDDEDDEDDIPIAKGRLMELHVGKYRGGEDKITIPVDAQFAKAYISEVDEENS